MSQFTRDIEKLISMNRIEQAIDEFQNMLGNFKPDDLVGQAEAKELRNLMVGVSQRYYQSKDLEMKGTMNDDAVRRERSNISNVILETIMDIDKYRKFNQSVNDQEEDAAWQKASAVNSIAGYKDYFSKYPNGRYVNETKKLMDDLGHIEEQKANELKRKAEEEKRRRELEEKRIPQEPATPIYAAPESRVRPAEPSTQYHSSEATAAAGNQAGRFSTLASTLLILCSLVPFVGPIVSISFGLYLRFSKNGGTFRYDDASRRIGLIMLIVGCVFAALDNALFH
jgi:hypothetical protein